MKQFSKKEVISYAWETVKKRPLYFAGITLLTIIATTLPRYVFDIPQMLWFPRGLGVEFSVNNPMHWLVLLLSIAGVIITYVISFYVAVGAIRFSLKFVDGKKGKIEDFTKIDKDVVLRYFLGSVVYGLIVLGGFILLIVPGIIWSIKYRFYGYLIIDKGMKPMDAIRKSGEITQGNKWNLFLLTLLLALINLLGLIVLLVGVLVTSAIGWIAEAYVYRKLAAKKS